MEMFGFLAITSGKPQTGKGWRIRKLAALPLGNAIMSLFKTALLAKGLSWASTYDFSLPYNELQPFFSPYFPEWQQALILPVQEFRTGRHIFKVHLGKCWRRIAIDAEATLYVLSRFILDSVNFDYDHMDQFKYKDAMGCTVKVDYPSEYMEGLATDEVKIGDVPIPIGGTMDYLFDFGDRWLFEVQLESVESPETEDSPAKSNTKKDKKSAKTTKKSAKRAKRKPQGEIIESHGEAPEQYPSYDDEW
ncbi:MAG: plasmid pRiA4b ORF-3 family protein [Moorea sp. SIO3C2]|nr:plasmid pRiA4b ORF-3 family protein [Moorena sp. SIO3C2]